MTQIHLPLGLLRLDGGTQSRAMVDAYTIARYAEAMEHGAPMPPVDVVHDGQDYWLADGFQRVAAARELGWDRILADVHQGTQRDAILLSVGANAQHGLPRSSDDKRRAVRKLLEDEEWGAWTDRKIAEKAYVSHDFVARVRAEVEQLSGRRPQIRTAQRGGTTYQMDTSGINAGRRPPQDPAGKPAAPKPGFREREERPRYLATVEAMRSIVLAQSTLPTPEEAVVDDPNFDPGIARRISGWWARLEQQLAAKAVRAS